MRRLLRQHKVSSFFFLPCLLPLLPPPSINCPLALSTPTTPGSDSPSTHTPMSFYRDKKGLPSTPLSPTFLSHLSSDTPERRDSHSLFPFLRLQSPPDKRILNIKSSGKLCHLTAIPSTSAMVSLCFFSKLSSPGLGAASAPWSSALLSGPAVPASLWGVYPQN